MWSYSSIASVRWMFAIICLRRGRSAGRVPCPGTCATLPRDYYGALARQGGFGGEARGNRFRKRRKRRFSPIASARGARRRRRRSGGAGTHRAAGSPPDRPDAEGEVGHRARRRRPDPRRVGAAGQGARLFRQHREPRLHDRLWMRFLHRAPVFRQIRSIYGPPDMDTEAPGALQSSSCMPKSPGSARARLPATSCCTRFRLHVLRLGVYRTRTSAGPNR